MKNGFLGALIKRLYIQGRRLGLSVTDTNQVMKKEGLPHSARTIFKVIQTSGIKIRRASKGLGRSDIKVKLGQTAYIIKQWINWAFTYEITFEDPDLTQTISDYIDNEIEPP